MAEEWTKGKVKDLVGKALIKGEDQEVINRKLAEAVRRKKKEIENYKRKRGEKRPDKNSLVGAAREKKEDKKEKWREKRAFPKGEWFPITNEFVEAVYKQYLRPNESKVFWFLIRKTWGWGDESDSIALKQFEEEIGIHKDNVSRALSSLRKRRIVVQLGNKIYGIQADTSLWRNKPKKKRA